MGAVDLINSPKLQIHWKIVGQGSRHSKTLQEDSRLWDTAKTGLSKSWVKWAYKVLSKFYHLQTHRICPTFNSGIALFRFLSLSLSLSMCIIIAIIIIIVSVSLSFIIHVLVIVIILIMCIYIYICVCNYIIFIDIGMTIPYRNGESFASEHPSIARNIGKTRESDDHNWSREEWLQVSHMIWKRPWNLLKLRKSQQPYLPSTYAIIFPTCNTHVYIYDIKIMIINIMFISSYISIYMQSVIYALVGIPYRGSKGVFRLVK